jgi:hypothetical protein
VNGASSRPGGWPDALRGRYIGPAGTLGASPAGKGEEAARPAGTGGKPAHPGFRPALAQPESTWTRHAPAQAGTRAHRPSRELSRAGPAGFAAAPKVWPSWGPEARGRPGLPRPVTGAGRRPSRDCQSSPGEPKSASKAENAPDRPDPAQEPHIPA